MKGKVLKKCLLNVIMFATYFPNGSGEKIPRREK